MKILLAVDVQQEFRDSDGHYEKILKYIEDNRDVYDLIVATVCHNDKDSNFVRYGHWYDLLNGQPNHLDFYPDVIFNKKGYGLPNYKLLPMDAEYTVIGYNTGACVLKVCLDLFDKGYTFRVLPDYCYSSDGLSKHLLGVEVLHNLLGSAVVPVL